MVVDAHDFTLPILKVIACRSKNPEFRLQAGALYCDGEPLDIRRGSLSDESYVARVQLLTRKLGIPELQLGKLAACWEQELQVAQTVSKNRLIELAKVQFGGAEHAGPLARWRQCFKKRLDDACPELHCVERFDGLQRAESNRILELAPIMEHWPERLLNDPGWAYTESPFGSIKSMPLDDVWVDIHFIDVTKRNSFSLEGGLHELQESRYQEQLEASVPPQFVLETLHGVVALIGIPGIGKTTLVKWLARQLIQCAEGRFLLPLVVPLRRYAHANYRDGLLSFALEQCGVRTHAQIQLWQEVFGYLAGPTRETVLLLLDGWDEVPEDRRELLRHEIDALSHSFTIVVTSRPSAYPRHWLPANRFFEITELSLENITALVRRWFETAGRPEHVSVAKIIDANPADSDQLL